MTIPRGYIQQRPVTVVEMYQRYKKSGCRIGKYGRKVRSKWEAGARVRKNKKYRKNVWVVGLNEKLVEPVAKQIQNQMGVHVAIGTLCKEEWEAAISKDEPTFPNVTEGSKTLCVNLPDEDRIISQALSYIEVVVPPKYRRYLREQIIELDAGEGEMSPWHVKDLTAAAKLEFDQQQAQEVEAVIAELTELYTLYAPEKVNGIPSMMKKYQGKEKAFLHAAKRKYERSNSKDQDVDVTCYHADCRSSEQKIHSRVNAEDLLGEDDTDGDTPHAIPSNQLAWEEEGLSTYF